MTACFNQLGVLNVDDAEQLRDGSRWRLVHVNKRNAGQNQREIGHRQLKVVGDRLHQAVGKPPIQLRLYTLSILV